MDRTPCSRRMVYVGGGGGRCRGFTKIQSRSAYPILKITIILIVFDRIVRRRRTGLLGLLCVCMPSWCQVAGPAAYLLSLCLACVQSEMRSSSPSSCTASAYFSHHLSKYGALPSHDIQRYTHTDRTPVIMQAPVMVLSTFILRRPHTHQASVWLQRCSHPTPERCQSPIRAVPPTTAPQRSKQPLAIATLATAPALPRLHRRDGDASFDYPPNALPGTPPHSLRDRSLSSLFFLPAPRLYCLL